MGVDLMKQSAKEEELTNSNFKIWQKSFSELYAHNIIVTNFVTQWGQMNFSELWKEH